MTNSFTPSRVGGNQPKLSKEEYAEKKRVEKERVYQMIDDTAVDVVSDPEKFKAFLDTQSRMDRYSAANALLIYNQLPQATQLKGFSDWGKDNVKIVKGAKSISILEPVEYTRNNGTPAISYNVKKVFDISQTNGKKAPSVSVNRDPKALITAMLDVCPVEVEATNELPYPNMAAFYNNDKQTLYVKRNVGDSVAVAQCVAQELGHAQLSVNSESYSRRDMGFQAVCIGYMLCKKYGIDTQNFAIDRIPESLSVKEPKEIRAELNKTRNAMAEIHSRMSDELYRKKQERSKVHER
ncbi:MAG: LtrC-like protein [Clostridiales bacterium]|nr:LtrC-like protein [Clostridiales bacterium]